jgi:hypothetical protein
MKEFKINTPTKTVNSQLFLAETGFNLYTRDDGFYVSGCETQQEADDAIAAHSVPERVETTVAEKLASVGLSIDDLKVALGI